MLITPAGLLKVTSSPLLAVLATVNPDGSPQATPVWYEYDGKAFIITSFANRVKVRNIRQNPQVSLVIVDTASYSEPLIISGSAEIIEKGAQEATLRGAIRYQGEKLGRVSAAHMAGRPRVIIRIRPLRITYQGEQAQPLGPLASRDDMLDKPGLAG